VLRPLGIPRFFLNVLNPEHSLPMNKAELVESVAKSLGGISRAEAERAVTAVVDGIRSGIRKDKIVQLVGFGTFKVAERAARMGVNPKTGQKIKIKKSKTVKFAVGKELKAKL
jgi:nucleoid DNA-binding protein